MPDQSAPGCLFAVLKLFGFGSPSEAQAGTEALPYRRKDYLLTQAERAFFVVLQQAVGGQYLLFAKVRALDLVWLPKGTQSRQGHLNRVQSKHVDFIVCSRDVVRPLVAIELDDVSHGTDVRKARDEFLDAAFKAAGLPLLHFPCKARYDAEELRLRIAEVLQPPAKQ